jgi:hypothetical protein
MAAVASTVGGRMGEAVTDESVAMNHEAGGVASEELSPVRTQRSQLKSNRRQGDTGR